MRNSISFLTVLLAALFILGCQAEKIQDPLVGVWDLSGKKGSIFNKGIAVLDVNNYAWIDANIYRYRYSNEFDRPILHLDGTEQSSYHLVFAHPDTLIVSDGLNALGVMIRTRGDLMEQYTRIANRELEQIRTRHGRDLGDQLIKSRNFLNRRYQ